MMFGKGSSDYPKLGGGGGGGGGWGTMQVNGKPQEGVS